MSNVIHVKEPLCSSSYNQTSRVLCIQDPGLLLGHASLLDPTARLMSLKSAEPRSHRV